MHLTTVALSHRYLLVPQLTALRDTGYDVVAVSADGPEVPELERMGIRHRALDGSTRSFDLRADLRALRSFIRIVREERPDLLHTHNPKPGLYGRIAGRMLGVPHVANTVHGLYATPEDPLTRRALVYGLEALAARGSHVELVQNIEDIETMIRYRIAPPTRIHFLGNGIDVERFKPFPDESMRRAVRAELGIADDAVVVASVGRLVAEKGFPELLEASSKVDAPHELVIIGWDEPEKADALDRSLIEEAKRRGVHFLGQRDDIDRLLPACDVFVLASHREGFPRAAMEAAACGLPVIATDIRGCRQVVDDGDNGILVKRRNAPELAEAIACLVNDHELRRTYGKAARVKAEADFDERSVVERLLSSYASVGLPTPEPARSAA